jgi:hypothetical protein
LIRRDATASTVRVTAIVRLARGRVRIDHRQLVAILADLRLQPVQGLDQPVQRLDNLGVQFTRPGRVGNEIDGSVHPRTLNRVARSAARSLARHTVRP